MELWKKLEQSNKNLQRLLNWKKIVEIAPQKQTSKRPKVSDLAKKTIQSLRKNHQIDLQFYDFALNYFDKQFLNYN